jgi:hypothetical protein
VPAGRDGNSVARPPAITNAPAPKAMPGGVVVQGGETIPARMILEQSTGYMWGRIRAPNSGPLIFVPDQLRGGAVDGNVVLLKVKMSTTKSAGKLYGRVVMILPDT